MQQLHDSVAGSWTSNRASPFKKRVTEQEKSQVLALQAQGASVRKVVVQLLMAHHPADELQALSVRTFEQASEIVAPANAAALGAMHAGLILHSLARIYADAADGRPTQVLKGETGRFPSAT